jgi:hypothetical protein
MHALIAKALEYKAAPFKDKALGEGNASGFYF